MKKITFIILGTFCINPVFATVYSGTYTSDRTITSDSIIDAGSVFNGANVYIKKDKKLTVNNNVQFINSGIKPSATVFTYGYYLALDGDDIVFRDGSIAIEGGKRDWSNPSNDTIHDVNIIINGNNILFDNNGVLGQKNGGAIYIGLPNTPYYHVGNHFYKQFLIINGTGTVFSNNKAQRGGGIYNDAAQIVFNSAVEFNSNSAQFYGGAIYNTKLYYYSQDTFGSLKIAPLSSFRNNSVANGSGGAIYNSNSYTFIGHDTLFSGNTASVNGGAIYNTGKNAVVDIDTGTTLVTFATASDSIYNDGGTINFLGTGQVNAGLTSLSSVLGDCADCQPVINLGKVDINFDTVNLSDNTILKTTVYKDGDTIKSGNISANTFNIQNDDRIKMTVIVADRQTVPMGGAEITVLNDASGSQSTGWDYFGNDAKRPSFALENNLLYDIEFVRDGVYKVTPKPFMIVDPSDTSDVVDSAFIAWNGNGFKSGSVADDIANKLFLLSQSASTQQAYNQALDTISPNSSGVLESFINHSANSNNLTIQRRQMTDNVGFWGNIDYSSVNYKNNNYSGSVIGGMLGQDVMLLNNLKTGMAFGYNQASITNDVHKFDISQQFNMSLYSKFSVPLNQLWLYADFALNHSQYDITETKSVLDYEVVSEFDADETSIQFDIGLKRKWFGFDIGARHNSLSLGNYTDSIGQHIDGVDLAYTYATTKAYVSQTLGSFTLGANVGADFLMAGDKQYKNIAVAPNMQRYYYIANLNADTILSFGASAQLSVTDRFSLGVVCDGIVDGDYSNHTAKVTFNYKL